MIITPLALLPYVAVYTETIVLNYIQELYNQTILQIPINVKRDPRPTRLLYSTQSELSAFKPQDLDFPLHQAAMQRLPNLGIIGLIGK